jgi:signal transduction histidine kinase/DNA-binding NarL/FixJ family response regulator/HPt (histidine-containing phosphotransfer) domain-containing protein
LNPSKPSLPILCWLALTTAALAAVLVLMLPTGESTLLRSGAFGLAALSAVLLGLIGYRARESERTLQDHIEALRRSDNERGELMRELERHSQLEQQLRQAKQDAESAVMAKGEFLATMSHEIRTPLNGIVPMLDLLMHNRLPQDQAELVHTAFLSSQQMLRIVDDILDYSKLEASKLQLESTNFNLRETLEAVIQLMERPAQSKGLRLNLAIDPSVRLPVRGDPVRLRQVVSNLLSNAVKFTERGSVSIHVRKTGETSAQHHLRFEVRDTGIGISQAAQERLFQAFSQADASTTRLYGGTGLGLAISRRIIELMGGRIGVDSEPGQGSTFWFEVPLLKVQGDISTAKAADVSDARVLVISGDQRLRLRLNMLLPNWGLRITAVESTQDALERLRSAAAQGGPWSYMMVLADLTGMRNTAVALQRNLERQNVYGNVRLICLQGDEAAPPELMVGGATLISRTAPDADLRAALLGQAVLSSEELPPQVSPIDAETIKIAPVQLESASSAILLGTPAASSSVAPVDASLQPHSAQAPVEAVYAPGSMPALSPEQGTAAQTSASAPAEVSAAAQAEAVRALRVLLVEDNPVNLMVGQRLLSVLGTHCDSATNGEAALLRMQASRYDLVLMDCQMPVMDGYTATRRWREHEAASGAARRLPIVAMTANAMAGDRQKCLDAGMDDYLAKPVTRGELERCLFHWQQVSQQGNAQGPDRASIEAAAAAIPTGRLPQAGPMPAQGPMTSAAPAAIPATPAEPPMQVLDLGILDELRGMLGSEVDRLIEVFLEDTPRLISALEAAAVGPDYEMLRNAAHTLKSSSANLGAVALSNAAKKVEHGARSRSLERPAVAVALIANEFARTRQALRATMTTGA